MVKGNTSGRKFFHQAVAQAMGIACWEDKGRLPAVPVRSKESNRKQHTSARSAAASHFLQIIRGSQKKNERDRADQMTQAAESISDESFQVRAPLRSTPENDQHTFVASQAPFTVLFD